jgi:hypothetical protein
MSAIERAIEKVKHLDEAHAQQLLRWLEGEEQFTRAKVAPLGAQAMLGFARRFRSQARTTANWMCELREGERE